MPRVRFPDGREEMVPPEFVEWARGQLAGMGLTGDNAALGAFLASGLDPAYRETVFRGVGSGKVPPQLAFALTQHLGEGAQGPKAPGPSGLGMPNPYGGMGSAGGGGGMAGMMPPHPMTQFRQMG